MKSYQSIKTMEGKEIKPKIELLKPKIEKFDEYEQFEQSRPKIDQSRPKSDQSRRRSFKSKPKSKRAPLTQEEVEKRLRWIQKCIDSLEHIGFCDDDECPSRSCRTMKGVVAHLKLCKLKKHGDCPICKQLIALCCYHANLCRKSKCAVVFCAIIKQKTGRTNDPR